MINMVAGKTYGISSILALVGEVIILAVALVNTITPTTLSQVILTATGLSTGVGVIIGALMMRSDNLGKVRTGGVLAVVFGAASIIAGAGFMIGLALSVLGGLIALLSVKS